SRVLSFGIPQGTVPGNYSLVQSTPTTTACGSDKITTSLSYYGQNYSLVSGSYTLSSAHPAFNNFISTFTATFKGDNNNEIISFANGQFNRDMLRLQ
ncbi:MAG: hypothetical protein H7Y27_06390, partial [Gemmatimonadaceae bacterium]|nr:hypothetical protein [Chitinophagaceae bacterium]